MRAAAAILILGLVACRESPPSPSSAPSASSPSSPSSPPSAASPPSALPPALPSDSPREAAAPVDATSHGLGLGSGELPDPRSGIECIDGIDPHPTNWLDGIGTVGGDMCRFAVIHGEPRGIAGDAASDAGRWGCKAFRRLRTCYDAARGPKGPKRREHFGVIDLAVATAPDAASSTVTVESSTVDDVPMTACVLAAFRTQPAPARAAGRFIYEVRFTQPPPKPSTDDMCYAR